MLVALKTLAEGVAGGAWVSQAHSPRQVAGTTLSPEGQPSVTQPVNDLPRFPLESDQAPSGDAARRPTSIPSTSVCSLLDPDTLSSDSTDSLRAQLCLMNQRINDVHTTIRIKDERGKSPLCGSPFTQEIQDTPIPQHFRLSMLEAYNGGSDPMEHVAVFQVQMALYGTSDAIIGYQGHSRHAPVIGYLGFHDRDHVFPPLLVARGATPDDRAEMLQRANQYVTTEALVAEKREDQRHPWAEHSRDLPLGLPRKRTERAPQAVPRLPNIPINSTRTEIFL
ncbi:hypothetical protein BHE74_00022730 [Ensete ventricosum]|nr:hypothetical protein BHE74_00022730 [Ensete ventricosum]